MSALSDQIVQLHKEGVPYRQIAVLLGCSKGTISYHVGVGQKGKNRERARDRRSQIVRYIQTVKQGTPCTDCKENYPYWIMEFDHLSDKEFNISASHRVCENLDRLKAEIAKCEVVCSNCHKNRTHTRLVTSGGSTSDLALVYG